jgi:hypothetical protein
LRGLDGFGGGAVREAHRGHGAVVRAGRVPPGLPSACGRRQTRRADSGSSCDVNQDGAGASSGRLASLAQNARRGKKLRLEGHVRAKRVASRWCVRENGRSTTAGVSGRTDLYNRQLHPDEKKAIAEKANGDQAEADRLTRAACYRVQCWAEYAPGSAERDANFVSQLEASQLGPELAWISRQQEAGLFNYTPTQKIADMTKSDPWGVAKDVIKEIIGGVTVKTGAGICGASGVGCALGGGGMIAFGLSDVAEGANSLYNRYNGISSPGTNPLRWGLNEALPTGWGDVAYDGLNLATAIAALKVPVPLKLGKADGLNRSGSMFDVTVPRINNNTLIPFTGGIAAPYGTTQAILTYGVGAKGVSVINDILNAGDKK